MLSASTKVGGVGCCVLKYPTVTAQSKPRGIDPDYYSMKRSVVRLQIDLLVCIRSPAVTSNSTRCSVTSCRKMFTGTAPTVQRHRYY